MAKNLNRALKVAGESVKVGTPVVTVESFDVSNNVTMARGATIPTDADRGYAAGCIFRSTATGLRYMNTGTATAAYFRPVMPSMSSAASALAKTSDYPVVAADFGKYSNEHWSFWHGGFHSSISCYLSWYSASFSRFCCPNHSSSPRYRSSRVFEQFSCCYKVLERSWRHR